MQNQESVKSSPVHRVVLWNYLLGFLLLLVTILLVYQLWATSQLPEPNAGTPIVVSLEGNGVIAQSFNLNLKEVNAQQTVVLTELNTKYGAPIAVKLSTDTSNQGATDVIANSKQ